MKRTYLTTLGSRAAYVMAMFVMTFACTNAYAINIKAPAGANAPSGAAAGMAPTSNPLTGPLSDATVGQTMMQVEAEPPVTTRGAGGDKLERLFAARCRSVVFIAHKVKDGDKEGIATGTGSIVSIDGHVLTAAHVVAGSEAVAVGIFPSCKPGAQPEFFPAKVVKSDPGRDLALLQLVKLPSDIAIMPIGKLDEVRTGSSVILIGHPQNLFMSLSQGTVSAIRPNFQFLKSRATVIQTDGALNPGNSGGPMMSDDGNLIGVNSFIKGQQSAGLNFAVAVTDVRDFLSGKRSQPVAASKPKSSTKKAKCKPKELKEWRKDKMTLTLYDFNCKGKGDAVLAIPDDKSENPFMVFDRNGDEKPDVIFSLDRKGRPLASKWDDDFDGEFDYRGKHSNGDWEPYKRVRI